MATTAESSSAEVTSDPTPGTDESTESGNVSGDCKVPEDCAAGLVCVEGMCSTCSGLEQPDAECAAAYPSDPFCAEDGRCAACVPESCSGGTPVCAPGIGCVACSEHSECPNSACHLAGPDAGECFAAEDVVEVQTPGAFAELLGEVGPGQDRVFVLGAATYRFPVESEAEIYDVDGEREVAILGNGSTVLEGSVGANVAFFGGTDDEAQLYLSRLEWNGTPADSPTFFPILTVGPGAELWLDDVTANGSLYLNDGAGHLRRSNLQGGTASPFGFNDSGLQGAGALFLENASVEPDQEHIRVGGVLDVRYSTLAIDGDVICGADTDGVVRNSIVLTGGDIADECEGAAWSGSAVNTAGFGTSVPAFDSGWFAPSAAVRFRLSPQGAEVFGDVAQWEEGDPPLDAEGDERPTMGPSAAGVDEP